MNVQIFYVLLEQYQVNQITKVLISKIQLKTLL